VNIDQFKNVFRDSEAPSLLMGILNVTPDSFSDGGKYLAVDKAVDYSLEMISQGADIIDVGGESTRPGSKPITLKEELQRVIPVIRKLREKSSTCISVDTYKSGLAREAIANGADIINDISGFNFDPDMVNVVRDTGTLAILMHIKGTPRQMQFNPHYDDLMGELTAYFRERLDFAHRAGLNRNQIILDPGIGFGKRLEDNFEIIRKLRQIVDLGNPVLIGPSRKSFIGLTLNLPPDERGEGTAAAVTAGILNGARILRIHDVLEMKRVITITDRIRGIPQA